MAAMEEVEEQFDDDELAKGLRETLQPAPVAVKEAKGLSFMCIGFPCVSSVILHCSFKCVLLDCVGTWFWWFLSMQEVADQADDEDWPSWDDWAGWQEGEEEEYLDEMVEETT